MFELFESWSVPSADGVSYFIMMCLGFVILFIFGLGIWLGLHVFRGES